MYLGVFLHFKPHSRESDVNFVLCVWGGVAEIFPV
jgi:hypothetical protein